MAFVTMLTLDAAAAAIVRDLRRRMAADGIPVDVDDPPHVSLASCGAIDVDGAVAGLAALAQSSRPIELSFESVGSFLSSEGTVFLSPISTLGLRRIQSQATGIFFQHGTNINPYYAGGRWAPHCTVANGLPPDQRVTALGVCAARFEPLRTTSSHIDLIEFGNGQATIHGSFDLAGGASIVGVDHVQITLSTGEEEDGRQFYCGLLGLPEIDKPASLTGRGGFWLQVGDRQVHVGTEADFDRTVTKAHIAYAVVGLDAWRSTLVDSGVDILDGVPIPGFDRFEFRDPFGNRVEMIEAVDV